VHKFARDTKSSDLQREPTLRTPQAVRAALYRPHMPQVWPAGSGSRQRGTSLSAVGDHSSEPLTLLAARFGFDAFRPGQERVVEALLAGRSALAVFPTGGGKSLCYQLPALLLEGVTVVVSPLIALMKDQIDSLQRLGVEAARLDSSLGPDEQREIGYRLRSGSLKLLYVAPERFNNERFLSQLASVRISLFAVDEAHCISEWGHNFRPDYLKLAERARQLSAERVLALTATATPAVVADIQAGFGIEEADAVVTGFYRPNLTLLLTPVTVRERDELLLTRLRERPPGSTIVYVTLQRTSVHVAEQFVAAGLPCRPYHAGMQNEERVATQEWWAGSRDGIVVATIAFGMGIDKADVRYVYHYNLPKSLESYSQEVGRAGRDGEESICELFACPDDVPTLENFAYGDTPTREALASLLTDVLEHPNGAEFAVSEYALSARHDLRPLVLKTCLTYLELDGVLRQGTPFYAGYRLRPTVGSLDDVFSRFDESRAGFLRRVVESGKTGRTWTTIAPAESASALGEQRDRIVAALEYLDQQGLVELQPAELRQRYTIVSRPDCEGDLIERLLERFARRERSETGRIQNVLSLVTHDGCQVRALVGYFGEARAARCGHCSHCLTGDAKQLPQSESHPPIDQIVEAAALSDLRSNNPDPLGTVRQVARFLAGITSPATSSAKLTRHDLFGSLADRRFADVLAWTEAAFDPSEKDGDR
jgi:ATP-dependent DNA helicase RecQ